MTPDISTIRKSVALDDETDAIVEQVSDSRRYHNYSLALRQIIREWRALQSNPPVAQSQAPRLSQPYPQVFTVGG